MLHSKPVAVAPRASCWRLFRLAFVGNSGQRVPCYNFLTRSTAQPRVRGISSELTGWLHVASGLCIHGSAKSSIASSTESGGLTGHPTLFPQHTRCWHWRVGGSASPVGLLTCPIPAPPVRTPGALAVDDVGDARKLTWLPWPNGQGVGLLIRRLRVRVPQGVHACLCRAAWPPEMLARRLILMVGRPLAVAAATSSSRGL